MNAPEVWWSPGNTHGLDSGLIEKYQGQLYMVSASSDTTWELLDELPADAVRLVPDTGQAREQILRRDITFGEYVIAVCDAIGLPHDSPRAAVVEAIRAAVAAAQAPESPTDSTPKAGRGGSSDAETATGAVQAPDVAALLRRLAELAERWELPLTKRTEAVALAYCTAARDLRRALTEEAGRG